jgi:hypothetical protein
MAKGKGVASRMVDSALMSWQTSRMREMWVGSCWYQSTMERTTSERLVPHRRCITGMLLGLLAR